MVYHRYQLSVYMQQAISFFLTLVPAVKTSQPQISKILALNNFLLTSSTGYIVQQGTVSEEPSQSKRTGVSEGIHSLTR